MIKAFILSFAMVFAGVGTEAVYTVNSEASTINWEGSKIGGKHNGTIAIKTGSLDVKKGKVTGGSFEIDMTSINNTDQEGEWKAKLEGHLKSADFFGVEQFPTAKFEIASAESTGGDKYSVKGKVTIKGITQDIEFPAMIKVDGGKVSATADLTIDRSKFDVRYGSDSFFDNLGDKVISDDIKLSISLVAAK
ncbi:MAG: YceI family protein [Cyclobacteriaceae bacterium]|nr:YceI family protein [Cyclobacteriaceae bacterium HetDA_MAG_MS6]